MNRDECIYFDSSLCASIVLAGVRPHCPWWTQEGSCACSGQLGRMGQLPWQREPAHFAQQPAPTLMRFRV